MDSSAKINEQAARWLVKRQGSAWGAQDQAELGRWLEESTANVVAYVRLESAWKEMGRLKSLGAGIKQGVVPSPDDWTLSPIFKPRHWPLSAAVGARAYRTSMWALAASLVLAVLAGVTWSLWPSGTPFRTPVGGLASVPMSDGSKITLNTDSKINVSLTEIERRVTLDRGEAFFEVAKDPKRPFVVIAGDKRVVAVGTAFSVRLKGEAVEVAVAEGSVKVAGGKDDVLLSAGAVVHAHRERLNMQRKPLQEVEEILSWRSGYLVFREATLAEAVAEFNRYNVHEIVIEDAGLAAIRLSGKFSSTKYDAFVRLLEREFPIRVDREAERIALLRREFRAIE